MRPINLIPTEQRRAKPSGNGSGGAYVVVGVLAVLVVMAVAYVTVSNGLNDKQTKTQEASQQADALEAQAAQLGSFTDFASIKDQRLASVVTTAQTRFDWERFMREVSRVIPEGSWLQTTQASVLGDPNAAANPTDPAAAAAALSPTATFVGCTKEQSEVAKLMVRLRGLHRVTDVKLNESGQEQSGTSPTFESCGKFYKFDVTVSFEPAAPVKEAPRGSVRVPASLGGGS
jgi:Tfp pilus assembly protein PilN